MMFDSLSEKITHVLKNIRGQGRLSEEHVSAVMRDVRIALLEADVALPVVKLFIQRVSARAIAREVRLSLTPGQAVVKIVHEELVRLMGDREGQQLNMQVQPPAVILVAGLQGAGKTTTVAKLGLWLKEKQKKSVMVASCDTYRPAAIQQLQILAERTGLYWQQDPVMLDPLAIAQHALDVARKKLQQVLIIDSAGRLHIDEPMMQEIRYLHQILQPIETLFVVDSMMGQDAVNAAQAFTEALPLTGVILTKIDGDARGGAALTVREITGAAIKFIGTGEKITAFSPLHPDRIASQILGMGDMLSLIEEVEQKADHAAVTRLNKKIKYGSGAGRLTLVDFREQLEQMRKIGGMGALISRLPGLSPAASAQLNDRQLIEYGAIINSMTPKERLHPAIINGARKRRIANGSGTQIQDVNHLLKQFMRMQKMMKRLAKKGGINKMLQGLIGNSPLDLGR